MYGIKEEQLKIFNLFLMADGKITTQEKVKLDAIYDAMNVEKKDRDEIEAYCSNALYDDESDDNSSQIIQIIKNLLGDKTSNDLLFMRSLNEKLNYNKSEQINTIWNLINLGYSDNDYSVPEIKLVKFLCDFWSIDNKTIKELEDSAETLVALYSQKEWIKTTNKSYDEINRFIINIENDIKKISKNIELTMEEIEM